MIGDLSHTYFVGNAPMGHMIIRPPETEQAADALSSFKVSIVLLFVLNVLPREHPFLVVVIPDS